MFRKTARFYDAIYSWKDYRTEVDRLDRLIRERNPRARTLLDVACGTGKHMELLRDAYEVEGIDLDAAMLAVARERLPGVPLHEGDMVTFDMGKRFDVVTCLFSSVAYARTSDRLASAIDSMARHLKPGGVLIVEPFFPPDQWMEGHVHALFVDEEALKISRVSLSGPAAPEITMSFHYLVGTPEGVTYFTEDHTVGLFTHEQYVEAFRAAGLEPEHDAEGLMGRGLYVAVAG
jgi:ubiquinone/menaquinone biosynthesis C-methylase UbiE